MNGHVLVKHMIQCRMENMYKCRTGFIGWHIMYEGRYYCKICGSGCQVFHKSMCYGKT